MKQVIDAVAELNLKVDSIAKQYRTLEQLALEVGKVRKSLSAMKKAENILQVTESSHELLEWFYDETTCFKLHVEAKPIAETFFAQPLWISKLVQPEEILKP